MKKNQIFSFLLLLWATGAICQTKTDNNTFRNPILKGCYPDPSICRVGDDFYLITSSFEYFPGVPIFHSKDLVNWQQLGHVLDRPSQLNLDGMRISGGIYAPTIRHNNGTFYMITTLAGAGAAGGNFFVTSKSARGPWSEPKWLPKEAIGIDPSLFFDDNGKVYYTGNKKPIDQLQTVNTRHIYLYEVDVETGKFIGERTTILEEGALHEANNAEAPHIYKKDGYYYLIIAEGGTGDEHAVTVFRSKNIRGPYEGNKRNPILTHRHLGNLYPITAAGHADFVDTKNGEWWSVLLGIRKFGGNHFNLGRETFLTPVIWEKGWPVVNIGIGKVLMEDKKPNLPKFTAKQENTFDNFSSDTLYHYWNFLRTPRTKFWSLTDQKGFLSLQLKPETIMELVNPSFIGRRQQDTSFFAESKIIFEPQKINETAGLVIMMNTDYQFRMEKILKNNITTLRLVKREKGIEQVIKEVAIPTGVVVLGIKAIGQNLTFYYKKNKSNVVLADNVDGRTLSRTNAGGFTGVYVGMYASSNGLKSENKALFDWFNYQEIK
jgi:alpha-N-arabinofuranosidase